MYLHRFLRKKLRRHSVISALIISITVMVFVIIFEWRRISAMEENPCPVKCPKQNILFLKTHKTGSSTLANVLNRYAEKRNLSVILPLRSNRYTFEWPQKFQLNHIRSFKHGSRILLNHARFNKAPCHILFPKRSSRYLSIVREPVSHFDSVYYFLGFHILTPYKTINDFLEIRLTLKKWISMVKENLAFVLSKNPLMFDLGFPFQFYENFTAITEYIHFLDQEMDLVLILEHFDESLVLLKRLLCLEMEDILYFKLMERLHSDKNKEVITKELRSNIRHWNQADVMLYDHFNETLWKKIRMEGVDFYNELGLFRTELRRIKSTCLQSKGQKTLAYTGKYVMGYEMKDNLDIDTKRKCERMMMSEVSYVDYFRSHSQVDEDDLSS